MYQILIGLTTTGLLFSYLESKNKSVKNDEFIRNMDIRETIRKKMDEHNKHINEHVKNGDTYDYVQTRRLVADDLINNYEKVYKENPKLLDKLPYYKHLKIMGEYRPEFIHEFNIEYYVIRPYTKWQFNDKF